MFQIIAAVDMNFGIDKILNDGKWLTRKDWFFMANQYIIKVKNSFCKYLNENKNICGIADAKVFETKEEANAFIKNSKDYEILKKYNN